jgi:hypothetical protein
MASEAEASTLSDITSLPCRARLRVCSGHNLAAADSDGFSDPYARCFINNQFLGRTETVYKNLNPSWQRVPVPWFYLRNLREFIASVAVRIEVWDSDLTGSDDFLGAHTLAGDALVRITTERKREQKFGKFWYPGCGKRDLKLAESNGNASDDGNVSSSNSDSIYTNVNEGTELELDTMSELTGTCLVSVSGSIRVCIEYEALADFDDDRLTDMPDGDDFVGADKGSTGPSSLSLDVLGAIGLAETDAYLKIYMNGKLIARTDVAANTFNPTWNFKLPKHPIFDTQRFRSSGTVRVEVWSSQFPDCDNFLGAAGFTGRQVLKMANGTDRYAFLLQRDDKEPDVDVHREHEDHATAPPRVMLVFDQHHFEPLEIAYSDELLVSANLHSRTILMLKHEMRVVQQLAFREVSIRAKQRASARLYKVLRLLLGRKLRKHFFHWFSCVSREWLNQAPEELQRKLADATSIANLVDGEVGSKKVRAARVEYRVMSLLMPGKSQGDDQTELFSVSVTFLLQEEGAFKPQLSFDIMTSEHARDAEGTVSFPIDEQYSVPESVCKMLRDEVGLLDMSRLRIQFKVFRSGPAAAECRFTLDGTDIWNVAPREFDKSRSRGLLLNAESNNAKLYVDVALEWGEPITQSLEKRSSFLSTRESHRCAYCTKHDLEISPLARSEAANKLGGCQCCGQVRPSEESAASEKIFHLSLLGLKPRVSAEGRKLNSGKLKLRSFYDRAPRTSAPELTAMRELLKNGAKFRQRNSLDLSQELKTQPVVEFQLNDARQCRDLEFIVKGDIVTGERLKSESTSSSVSGRTVLDKSRAARDSMKMNQGKAQTGPSSIGDRVRTFRIQLRHIHAVGQGLPPLMIEREYQTATRQSIKQRENNYALSQDILYLCFSPHKKEKKGAVDGPGEEILARREWLILRLDDGDGAIVTKWAEAIRSLLTRHKRLVQGLRRFLVSTNRATPKLTYVLSGKGQYATRKKLCAHSVHMCTTSQAGCCHTINAVFMPDEARKERLEFRRMRFEFPTIVKSKRPRIFRDVPLEGEEAKNDNNGMASSQSSRYTECYARAAPSMYWLRKDLAAYLKELVETPDVPALGKVSPFWRALAGSGRDHVNFSTYYPGDIVKNKWRQFAVHLLSLLPDEMPHDACLHVRPGHAPLDPNACDANGDYLNYNVGHILFGGEKDKKKRQRSGVLAASSRIKLVAGEITKMVKATAEDAFEFFLAVGIMRVNRNHAVRHNTPYNDHEWLSQSALRAGLIYDHVWSQLESTHHTWHDLNGPASRPGSTRGGECIVNIDTLCKKVQLPEVRSHQSLGGGRGKNRPQWDYQERSLINGINQIMSGVPNKAACLKFIQSLKRLVHQQSELFLDPNVKILGQKILKAGKKNFDETHVMNTIWKEVVSADNDYKKYMSREKGATGDGGKGAEFARRLHWVKVQIHLDADSIAPNDARAPMGSVVIQGNARGLLVTPLIGKAENQSLTHITIIPMSGLFHSNDHLTIRSSDDKSQIAVVGLPGPEHSISLPKIEHIGSTLGTELCQLRGCLSNISRNRFIYCFTHTYTNYLVFREEDQQRVDSNNTWQQDKKRLTESQVDYLESHFFGKDMPHHLDCIFTLAATHFLLQLLRGNSYITRPNPERYPPYHGFSAMRERMHASVSEEIHTELIHRLGPILQGSMYSKELLQATVVGASWEDAGPPPRHLLVPTEAEDINVMYEGGAKGTDMEFKAEQEIHASSTMAADKGEITYHMQYKKSSSELSNGNKFRDERPSRAPLRYLDLDTDGLVMTAAGRSLPNRDNVRTLWHMAPAKLFLRHAFRKLAMNAAGVLPADISVGYYKGGAQHYTYNSTKEDFVCGAFDSMIEKIPRIRVETQKLKPQIKVWQNCHKSAEQIGLSAKVTYENRALSLMAKVGMDGASAIGRGGKIEVDKAQMEAVLAKMKDKMDEVILEKKHWDESVNIWRHKLVAIKPNVRALYEGVQTASVI